MGDGSLVISILELRSQLHIEKTQNRFGDLALFVTIDSLIIELLFWVRLSTFLIHVLKKLNLASSLILQLEASVLNTIADDVVVACRKKYISKNPKKLRAILRESAGKIQLLKPEIGQALQLLLAELQSPSFLSIKFYKDYYLLWIELLVSVDGILECIGEHVAAAVDAHQTKQIHALKTSSYLLRLFLDRVRPYCESDFSEKHFSTHVASVALRIVNQSFQIFAHNMDPIVATTNFLGLLDLKHQIDPTTPQFMELILNFLKALNERIGPAEVEHSVYAFLRYLLDGKSRDDVSRELSSLVIFVISETTTEEGSTQAQVQAGLQRLLTEIKQVLILAGSLYNADDPKPLTTELLMEIDLLKAEIFIKSQPLLKSGTISLQEDLIEELNDVLNNLIRFSKVLPLHKIAKGKQILALVEEVARDVRSVFQSFHGKKVKKELVRSSLFPLLLKIVLFKAESSCMELQLLNDHASSTVLGKDQIETLLEGLKLFTSFCTNHRTETPKDVELVLTHIEVLAREITFLHLSSVVNKVTGETSQKKNKVTGEIAEKMNISFSDLLDKMTHIRAELRDICLLLPRSNFPKTDGMSFIGFLLGNLRELLKRNPDSIARVKNHIREIRLDLEFLRSFLMNNISERGSEDLALKNLGTCVTDVAYEVEHVIDSIEVGIGTYWQHGLWLDDLLEKIRLVKMRATEFHEEKTCDDRAHYVAQISGHMVPQSSATEIDEVVCLSDEEEIIIDQLTRGSSERDTVSIVGMPGIGKTTLAKKVFNDPRVSYHFHICAWCSVSQVYGNRQLLLDILSDISGLTDGIHQMDDEDLELQLYQCLKRRKYLIVMDDVWETRAWTDLERSFPDDGNGSRILITSRLRDVALKTKAHSNPHELRLLSDDESWKLLQMKIFHQSCPDELLEVGKEIAKNCKGLPLAVVAIAGLLGRTEKRKYWWTQIAESLSSRIMVDTETRCRDILELSYKHLPDYLKACFLYTGAFLEDRDIPVRKLIRLWIAEGFIERTELKSLEDLADDYLMDLIGRSMLIVSKQRSKGRVKSFRIHDMLRDLCLLKAKEENFLQLITRYDEPYASFDDLDDGAGFFDYYPSNPVTYEGHRLCICLKRKHFFMSSPFGPWTRSLVFFATIDSYSRRPYDISFISHHFKLLRVLDLEDINMGSSFPTGIELLVHLRYLALSGDLDSIPQSVGHLWRLETFIVKGLKGKIILPNTVWCMASLRHVHVDNHLVFSLEDDNLGTFSPLGNLVSFSSPSFSYGKHTEKIIRRLPNLRKLGCIFLESSDSSRNCNQFPELDLLIQLESLKIYYFGRFLNPCEFNLPLNLKKLTLLNFRLPWNHSSSIGRLPNLEVLKLRSRAFEGPIWDMREEEFLKLKFLKLDTLNIAHWNACSDHLPNLQYLVIQNCKDLEEVPFAFGEIPTLRRIEVQFCAPSAEKSVKRIGEEGIEGLKIIINQRILV